MNSTGFFLFLIYIIYTVFLFIFFPSTFFETFDHTQYVHYAQEEIILLFCAQTSMKCLRVVLNKNPCEFGEVEFLLPCWCLIWFSKLFVILN